MYACAKIGQSPDRDLVNVFDACVIIMMFKYKKLLGRLKDYYY